jgi:hypothetical protein
MINLLPPDIKSNYRYARHNVVLRRWVVTFLVGLVGLGGLATYGLLTLHQSTAHYNDQIIATNALFKQEKFAQTQAQVQDISNNFKLVVKVLDQEVLFSELLTRLATLMPQNAALTGLNVNQAQTSIDIIAGAPDYNTATQVQVNIADPANKIFSKADIVGINCGGQSSYPCTIDIRALFVPNNPFLFINSKASNP